MSRHRSSTKKSPPDIGLHMECVEEELEPAQIDYYKKAEKDFNDVQKKLDDYIKKMKAEVVERGENCFVLQINASPPAPVCTPAQITTTGGKSTRQTVSAAQNYQQVVTPGIITRSNVNSSANTYLVMDPRLSFMVGQMPSPVTTEQPSLQSTPKTGPGTRGRSQSNQGAVTVTTRAKSGSKNKAPEHEVLSLPLTRTRDKTKSQGTAQSAQQSSGQQQVYTPQNSAVPSTPGGEYKIRINAKPLLTPSKAMESCALGGLTAGTKTPWKPQIDDSNKSNADSKEVAFNKHTAKTFPSLVVVARPHLKVKYIQQNYIHIQRTALDGKVKSVLMYTASKFTEWLIQQGLIRSEQTCQIHLNNDMSPVKLKLGMYSVVSKFPYSGGYVWISDCCPSQFVSVFSGSIFEGAPHPPTTLLKLIYHWACQTNVQNVVQWVKVDNLYLKSFYTNMRAVCTQVVHEKYQKVGGPGKKIEVGVISLGTTSQDGNKRQVKVEVLGVMDPESKLVRLRAVEPFSDERNFKRRFVKILEPLVDWVDKESIILIDFTVAKAALNSMGFNTVYQVTDDPKYSNQNVMEYLRRIVPRMFQNTLSLLSRQIIQQFLDELVWREMWGPIPAQAFRSIVSHLSEITKLDVSENFLTRLQKVASNPFKKWNYSVWKSSSVPATVPATSTPTTTRGSSKAQQKASSTSQDSSLETSLDTPESSKPGKGVRTRKRGADQSSVESSPAVAPKKVAKVSGKEKTGKKEKEPADKLPEEIIKFMNEGKQIPLENFYYGNRHPHPLPHRPPKGPFSVKCCVCNKKYTENIILMKHIILHCQMEPALVIDLKKVHQCEHCFLGFNTSAALKVHLEEVHFVVNNKLITNLICQICELKFKNRHDLVYHMQRTHVQSEMPYECGVCRFRTSVYKVFVDHFLEVHRGEEYVFCPYCLKIVSFSYKGQVITLNVLFYLSHLEKHQRLSLIKDCNRCQLSFIHKGILDQHLDADHGTWKDEGGVEEIPELPTGISMPEPVGFIKPAFPTKPVKSPKTRNLFASNKFKSLEVFGLDETMACLECEESLTKSDHFTGSFNCLKCRFASCCEKAMMEHLAIFHETPHPQFTKGRPIVLSNELYCICGYSSRSGNRIAKHLAICERKSAFPSKETAAAAIKTSSEDQNKQGEGQNMLNMLGLVRKSPEVTVVQSEVVKMEVDVEDPFESGIKQEIKEIEKTTESETPQDESTSSTPKAKKRKESPKTDKSSENMDIPEENQEEDTKTVEEVSKEEEEEDKSKESKTESVEEVLEEVAEKESSLDNQTISEKEEEEKTEEDSGKEPEADQAVEEIEEKNEDLLNDSENLQDSESEKTEPVTCVSVEESEKVATSEEAECTSEVELKSSDNTSKETSTKEPEVEEIEHTPEEKNVEQDLGDLESVEKTSEDNSSVNISKDEIVPKNSETIEEKVEEEEKTLPPDPEQTEVEESNAMETKDAQSSEVSAEEKS